jgi:tRNA pseudouridine38-40 synthase
VPEPEARAATVRAPFPAPLAHGVTTSPDAPTLRWRLHLAYDGSGFRGFAAQPGIRTVSGALSDALGRVLRCPPPHLVCAGRTDAGVHARGQVVHVELPAELPTIRTAAGVGPMSPPDLIRSLNRILGGEIVVHGATPVAQGFDARRSATGRTYRYLIWNAPEADPLWKALAWHVGPPLDVRAMAAGADALIGEHDFRSMCRRAPEASADEPIIRVVRRADWSDERHAEVRDAAPGRMLRFEIEATSFCHQMVRSIVANLVDVGSGRTNVGELVARLRSASRVGAPRPAPAHALCLVSVSYEFAG